MLSEIQSSRGDKKRRFIYDNRIYRDFKDVGVMSYDREAMNNAVRNILMTRKGSLPGKPDFGSNIYQVPFSQLDYITENLLKSTIKDAIDLFEPRILITNINITKNEEYNQIVADIEYRYRYNGENINNIISIPISV